MFKKKKNWNIGELSDPTLDQPICWSELWPNKNANKEPTSKTRSGCVWAMAAAGWLHDGDGLGGQGECNWLSAKSCQDSLPKTKHRCFLMIQWPNFAVSWRKISASSVTHTLATAGASQMSHWLTATFFWIVDLWKQSNVMGIHTS